MKSKKHHMGPPIPNFSDSVKVAIGFLFDPKQSVLRIGLSEFGIGETMW